MIYMFSSYVHTNLTVLILYFQHCLMLFCLSQSSFNYSFWHAFQKCLRIFSDILYTNIDILFSTAGSSIISPSIQMSGYLANTRKNNIDRTTVPRRTSEGAVKLKFFTGIRKVPVKIFAIWETYDKEGEENFYFHILSLAALNLGKDKKHQTKCKTLYQSW